MKPSFKGQRSVSSTDQKFRPTDEHLIAKNKEELDKSEKNDSITPLSGHKSDKFADIDKDADGSENGE
ncbi:MAG: hypothetical protein M3Z30_01455 [Gemmatimonadota bacterium]|nr:hypothetical protein [Gemmatimonadota bacterium]